MRRLFAAFALASAVSLSAMIPSASAQGVGFFQPPFNTGLAGCTNLNGVNQALFPTLPNPLIGVTQCPLGFNNGLGLGVGGTGQLSAQALPGNNALGLGANNLGLGFGFPGLGFGGIGGLNGVGGTGQLSAQALPGNNALGLGANNLGLGFGFPGLGFGLGGGLGFGGLNGLGVGGTGQLSAQALPTNTGLGFGGGLGAFGGLGFGLGGLFGVNGGVNGFGFNCISLGIIC
jgi:hypothetical protein